MNRWRGKTAVVTGAASGIGAAITDVLLEEGINVAAFDVQHDRLEKKAKLLTSEKNRGKLFPVKCDLRNESEILDAFEWVKNNLQGVDIMINNAGVIHYSKVIESETQHFRKILDINLLAVAICTREAVASMRARNVEGHVFNINSTLGHEIPENIIFKGWNLYVSCKHATVALSDIVRRELIDVEAKVRLTSISPGMVNTEIVFDTPEMKNYFDKAPALLPTDIAEGVIYALRTRPEVQITELTIRRTGEP